MLDEAYVHDRLIKSHFKMPANELKANFRVVFSLFSIKKGKVIHTKPVLQASIVEQKMLDGVIAKAR